MTKKTEDSKRAKQQTWSPAQVTVLVTLISAAALCAMGWWASYVKEWAAEPKPGEAVQSYSEPGAFGDSFAPIVGIFTSLTLAAGIASVFMQRAELAAQRDEMEDARTQWTAQAEAMADANKLQRRANDLAERSQLIEIARQMSELDRRAAELIQWAKDHERGTQALQEVDPAAFWHEFWTAHPNTRMIAAYSPRILCDYAEQRSLLLHMYKDVRASARAYEDEPGG